MPNSPQQDAGMRIEPPPSPPPAIGTIRLATAAADPPLDPPLMRSVFHGFRVGPNSSGSVYGVSPSSGVPVFPSATSPVLRNRVNSSLSWPGPQPSRKRDPQRIGSPATSSDKSLIRNGTPRNGPSGSPAATSSRPRSNIR